MFTIVNSQVFRRKGKLSPMAAYREQFSAAVGQELEQKRQDPGHDPPNIIGAMSRSCSITQHSTLKTLEKDAGLTKYEVSIIQWEVLAQLVVKYPEKLKAEVLCDLFENTVALFGPKVYANANDDTVELYSKFWNTTRELITNIAHYLVSNCDSILYCASDSYSSTQNLLRIFSTVTTHLQLVQPIRVCLSEIRAFEQKCLVEIMDKFSESAQMWAHDEVETMLSRNCECTIESVIGLVSELNNILKIRKLYLTSVLESLKINLFRLIFTAWKEQIFSLLRMELKPMLGVINSPDWFNQQDSTVQLQEDLFTLYQKLSNFLKLDSLDIVHDCVNVPNGHLQISPVARMFLPCVLRWIELIRVRNSSRIQNAVNLDNLKPVDEFSLVSSSAVDVSEMILKVNDFWTELAWPVPEESYCLLILVIQNVYALAFQYIRNLRVKLCDEIHLKIKTLGMLDLECIVLNNIEQVIQHVRIATGKFQINKLLDQIAIQNGRHVQLYQYAVALPDMVKSLQNKLNKLFTKIMKSVNSGQVLEAVVGNRLDKECFPIYFELLENIIASFKSKLSPSLFPNMVDILWRNILNALGDLAFVKVKWRESIDYHNCLHILLLKMDRLIRDCCSVTKARAYPSRVLQKNSIQATKLGRLLRLRASTTRELQIEYLTIRFCEQSRVRRESKISLGHVTIRAAYFCPTETLNLEIVNAALNEDVHHSYVKVQMLLRESAEESRFLYTQVKTTSYPRFEAIFAIGIPRRIWAGGGVIRLWVKTRTNPVLQHRGRIIGEAFWPLETVVTTSAVAPREVSQPFLRLQLTKACSALHCDLISMILNILRTRSRDKSAFAFVRRELHELKHFIA